MHPNLAKAVRDFDTQMLHMIALAALYGVVLREPSAYLGERTLPLLCHMLAVGAMELLGTACTRGACAKWHTDPDDR